MHPQQFISHLTQKLFKLLSVNLSRAKLDETSKKIHQKGSINSRISNFLRKASDSTCYSSFNFCEKKNVFQLSLLILCCKNPKLLRYTSEKILPR